MLTLADRLEWALQRRKDEALPGERVSKAGLARACGIAQPSVSDWFSGHTQSLEGTNLLAAAAYLRVSPEWLATGKGNKFAADDHKSPAMSGQVSAVATQFGGVSHPMSLRSFTLPVTLTWEQVMQSQELPERFIVESPDDALSPRLPRGTAVVFERAGSAQPGECVLVRDKRGATHMRRYVQGVGAAFTAQALHDAYASFESVADGLEVLAVMAWRAERRL